LPSLKIILKTRKEKLNKNIKEIFLPNFDSSGQAITEGKRIIFREGKEYL
jgi:hypothetical protein